MQPAKGIVEIAIEIFEKALCSLEWLNEINRKEFFEKEQEFDKSLKVDFEDMTFDFEGYKTRLWLGSCIALCDKLFGRIKGDVWNKVVGKPANNVVKDLEEGSYLLFQLMGIKETKEIIHPIEALKWWSYCVPCEYRFRCMFSFSLDFLKIFSIPQNTFNMMKQLEERKGIHLGVCERIDPIVNTISQVHRSYVRDIIDLIDKTCLTSKTYCGWPTTYLKVPKGFRELCPAFGRGLCPLEDVRPIIFDKKANERIKSKIKTLDEKRMDPLVTALILEYLAIFYEIDEDIRKFCNEKEIFKKGINLIRDLYEGHSERKRYGVPLCDGAWMGIEPAYQFKGLGGTQPDYSLFTTLDIVGALNNLRIYLNDDKLKKEVTEYVHSTAEYVLKNRLEKWRATAQIRYLTTFSQWREHYTVGCHISDITGMVKMLNFLLDTFIVDRIVGESSLIGPYDLPFSNYIGWLLKQQIKGYWPIISHLLRDAKGISQPDKFQLGNIGPKTNISFGNTMESLMILSKYVALIADLRNYL